MPEFDRSPYLSQNLAMKYLSFLLFVLLLPALAAQDARDTLPHFPADFTGVWVGELKVYTIEGFRQSVPMELQILPVDDSTYTYTIIYGEDREAGKRPYLLRAGKDGPHHWVVDEDNGILLDNFYVGGILNGPFSIMGTSLFAHLERRGEHLYYAITSGPEDVYRSSKATEEAAAEVDTDEPEIRVETFKISNQQSALLRRQ